MTSKSLRCYIMKNTLRNSEFFPPSPPSTTTLFLFPPKRGRRTNKESVLVEVKNERFFIVTIFRKLIHIPFFLFFTASSLDCQGQGEAHFCCSMGYFFDDTLISKMNMYLLYMPWTLAAHFSHSSSVLTDIVLVKNVPSVKFHNQAAFLIFLEHFIPLKVQQMRGGCCVIAAQLAYCNILASSESSVCCASVLCYWSCFQLWIHGSGWRWRFFWPAVSSNLRSVMRSSPAGSPPKLCALFPIMERRVVVI